jgi:aspartate kinase
VLADIRREFDELVGLVHALAVLREVSPRSRDAVLATGEVVSSRIVAAAFADRGIRAEWVDARRVLVTDAEHTGAAPDMLATRERALELVAPVVSSGALAILGGFIGATAAGITSTLGRGGSDYSAAIFGASLDVDDIQIWTDVDGMLTADPRIVPQPKLVPQLSFAEASELAYFGAKVLHPSTILPAVAKNIPVRILNSRRPENTGTRITAEGAPAAGQLTALACKRDVTVVDITSTRMLGAHGFLRRLFEVFERFKTAVDVVTTSEVSVSVTVDDTRRLEAILDNLHNFAEATCERQMAIICAVGENLRADPTVFGRAVMALERVPLRLVSQAASRRNVTFVLRDSDVPHAMMRLHETFFSVPVGAR